MRRSFTVNINNNIITQKCRTIKKMALFSLKGRWAGAAAVAFACTLITKLPDIIGGFYETPETGFDAPFFILSIISVLITGAVTMSASAYYLSTFRMLPAGKPELLSGIKNYKKAVVFGALQFLLTIIISQGLFLASLIGIITYLSIALVYFVSIDNPEKTVGQCIASSRFMMVGNKSKLIKLLFSFIGWLLVANFVSTAIQVFCYPGLLQEMSAFIDSAKAAAEAGTMIDVSAQGLPLLEASENSVIVQLARMICNLGVSVYINTSLACFYDLAAGNIITEGDKSDLSAAAFGNRNM